VESKADEEHGGDSMDLPRVSKLGGMLLIGLVGLIHLVEAPDHFDDVPYIGWIFLVLVLGTLVSIIGIDQEARWGWQLGVVLSGISFVAFIISRTLGLPAYSDAVGDWDQMGIFALFVEALFIALYIITPTGRNQQG
jgi:hypothetical protein